MYRALKYCSDLKSNLVIYIEKQVSSYSQQPRHAYSKELSCARVESTLAWKKIIQDGIWFRDHFHSDVNTSYKAVFKLRQKEYKSSENLI